MKTLFSILLAIPLYSSLLHAQVDQTTWDYNWNASTDPLWGNNNGGTWQNVSMSQNEVTGALSINLTTSLSSDSSEHTEALWMSITNGPTPTTVDSDFAAIYLYSNQFYITPYANDPTEDHNIGTIILQGAYTVSHNAVNQRTFSLTVDTNAVNNWAGAPPNWKGIGFPKDAQGNTAGSGTTPNRMGAWMRSFEADGLTFNGTLWDVTYTAQKGGIDEVNVGNWDTAHSFPVPEPSSTALLGLGGLALILRRKK